MLVIWPGGPHHFLLDEATARPSEGMPGWVYVQGLVVKPSRSFWPARQAFLARRTDYGYELMPHGRDPIAIWEATRRR